MNINKIVTPGGVPAVFRSIGVCETARGTRAKVVTTADGDWKPYDGATIIVKFTSDNTVSGPTLNVDGSGAYNIYYGIATVASSTSWIANSTVEFVFDATSSCYRYLGFPKASSSSSGDGDTKNTAGSTDTSSKIFLIGATSQAANPQTYSHDTAYVGTDGHLYSGGVRVLAGSESTSDDDEYPILIKDTPGTDDIWARAAFNEYVTLNPNTRTLQVGSASSSSYYGKVQAGNGFYQTSDERLKDFGEDVKIDFNVLKSIPKKYFTWKDDEEKNSNIGTSAQVIQKIYPELVSDSNGTLVVDYNKLSVIALKAVDELHAENQELKDRLTKLEEMIYGNRN